jgi:hypothetical protein
MPNLPKENWLLEVYDLSSKNELDKAADILFDKVDDLLLAGDFKGCDSLRGEARASVTYCVCDTLTYSVTQRV